MLCLDCTADSHIVKSFLGNFYELSALLNCKFKFHPSMEFNPANLPPLNSGI